MKPLHDLLSHLPQWRGALTQIACDAGEAILAVADEAQNPTTKQDGSPVTKADLAANACILAGLLALAPGIPIVSEESTPPDANLREGPFFLVDPLDGTREFVAGRDEYTVNVALIAGGMPVLGVVGAPLKRTIWRGGRGLGAQRLTYDRQGRMSAPVSIHARACPAQGAIAAISLSHPDADTQNFLATHPQYRARAGGSALKFCWVAEGEADIYPRFGRTSEWDIAAGHALIEAAGGRMAKPDGRPIEYGRREDNFLVDGFFARGTE